MLVDITGVVLIPGNCGKDCPGNGNFSGLTGFGLAIECCCDECDYLMCCDETYDPWACENCTEDNCPRVKNSAG